MERETALKLAERFGATSASAIRAAAPLQFAELRRRCVAGVLNVDTAFEELKNASSSLPSPQAGIELLQCVVGSSVVRWELERGFVRGLIAELKLHADLRDGADSGIVIPEMNALPF